MFLLSIKYVLDFILKFFSNIFVVVVESIFIQKPKKLNEVGIYAL